MSHKYDNLTKEQAEALLRGIDRIPVDYSGDAVMPMVDMGSSGDEDVIAGQIEIYENPLVDIIYPTMRLNGGGI